MYGTGTSAVKLKGMIPYPCCPQKKAAVEMGASGCATHQCPNCGKFVEFNYDLMQARRVNAYRGAVNKYNKQCR